MASRQGALPPDVERIVGVVFAHVPIHDTGTLFERGSQFSNQVAAMPSLHAAYALLIGLFLWPLARRWWWRVLLAAYPPAMGLALVYTGEHYVVDELAGVLTALLAWTGAAWAVAARARSAPGSAALGPAGPRPAGAFVYANRRAGT
jgi:membrane-associated phospholipid phosphatase